MAKNIKLLIRFIRNIRRNAWRYICFISKLLFSMLIFCYSLCSLSNAQGRPKARNIFVITIDGFRWEELFNGADSSLIFDTRYVKDTMLTRQMFWDSTPSLRRQRLMPFFWNVIAKQGQLYGNRLFNNKVDVKNIYKIS